MWPWPECFKLSFLSNFQDPWVTCTGDPQMMRFFTDRKVCFRIILFLSNYPSDSFGRLHSVLVCQIYLIVLCFENCTSHANQFDKDITVKIIFCLCSLSILLSSCIWLNLNLRKHCLILFFFFIAVVVVIVMLFSPSLFRREKN